jgi:hypothetical protein
MTLFKRRSWLGIAIHLCFLAGCAGASVGNHSEGELPKDIPEDMKHHVEIQDPSDVPPALVNPWASPTPRPTVVVEKKKAKSKKKKKTKLNLAPDEIVTAIPTPVAPFAFPNRRPAKDPVWIGEQTTYEITYFGMSAGDFVIDVLPYKMVGGRKAYHLRGTADTSKVFSLFYRIHDVVESYMDFDGLFSQRFHILLDETKQTRDGLELNDSQKAQTYYWNRWTHVDRGYTETKEYSPIEPFSQDSLSALYYLRMVPLPEGAVFSFPVVSEGKTWEAIITVVRREMMDTPFGRVQTVVVKPDTKFQGVLQKRGDSFIWLTDDDRRTVVRLEAKVKIGTVVARLKKFEPGTPP